jgi:hypothetical protein
MTEYSDILGFLEEIVEEIEFDNINLNEVKKRLQYIINDIEVILEKNEDLYNNFNFDDLD